VTAGSDGGGIRPAAEEEEEADIFLIQGTRKETWEAGPRRGTRARGGPGGYGGGM
jgi:hypothetical protein